MHTPGLQTHGIFTLNMAGCHITVLSSKVCTFYLPFDFLLSPLSALSLFSVTNLCFCSHIFSQIITN